MTQSASPADALFERKRYFADNYVYLFGRAGDFVLVDPGDADVALAACREAGVRPRWILHTHGHADHSGGTARVKPELGATVLGHRGDAPWYTPDVDVAGQAELTLGALRVRVHPTPGHTPGSVLYEWEGRLLTGDTLFWGGCGNCRHGGDPARLAQSFDAVIRHLDGALEVHPGHDYGLANVPFTLELQPDCAAALERLEALRADREAGREPRAPALEEERASNLFLRPGTVREELVARGLVASGASDVACFVALRALRDGWKAPAPR